MKEYVEKLKNGEPVVIHKNGFTLIVEEGSEGFNGDIYKGEYIYEWIEDNDLEPLDGGICQSENAEEIIEFFLDSLKFLEKE